MISKKHYLNLLKEPDLWQNIVYLEAQINYTNIHFVDGSVKRTSYTLNKYVKMLLSNFNFIRIHKTYLVNVHFVTEIDLEVGNLKIGNIILPISRRKLNLIKENKYLADKFKPFDKSSF